MNILSFQFEDFFSISHELGLVVMNSIRFALSGTVFISLSFLKDNFSGKSTLGWQVFLSQLFEYVHGGRPNCCWWWKNRCSPTSCGWFKSELSSPGQISPWFLLSWYMCLMSFKIPPKLSVAFSCEFSFSFFGAVLGICRHSAWASQCGVFS